ncbi:hypothetical protein [Halarcobacter sp.]|uniref:hypothetical protein n=1 Tax=Halarcobacter sp. TaxID=2321133 RepID=UPI002AAC23A7|nr:hypothetical protein [Halarcobacter sp.]
MFKILILSLLFIYVFSSDKIDLKDKNLDIQVINPKNLPIKTKKDYEDKDKLKEAPLPFDSEEKKPKNNNLEIDGNVKVDKENKKVDVVNINLGTKF